MNRSTWRPLAALALLATMMPAPRAWGFAAQGHELVADVAQLRLQNEPEGAATLARVQAILAPGETLASASTWADRVKSGGFDADSKAFLAKVKAKFGSERAANPWHYVDIPFQEGHYERTDLWTRPDDIVQMIRICAQTLHDGKAPADAPIALSQREALRLLIHYVGDEHQPLHVGCGYLPANGEANGNSFIMPSESDVLLGRVVDDQGGNALRLIVNGAPVADDYGDKKLHSYWDADAVTHALRGQSAEEYAKTLLAIAPQPDWDGQVGMLYWPKQWADDAIRQSALAYQGVTILGKNAKGWDVQLAPDYDARAAALVQTQLAKGGYRLAQILKATLPALTPYPDAKP